MTYDIIVIGSGPGGYVAAIRASHLGYKVAVVEKESLGGICLNWGCIPTKALLKTASVYESMTHAKDYGIIAGDVKPDFSAVIKRSRGVADKMSKGVQFLMKKNKIDVLMGMGSLAGANTVSVTDKDGAVTKHDARHIILATGARSRQLPNMPFGPKVIGYRDAMVLPTQPASMIVVGSGAIGVEFAYFYNSIGTKVTIVEFLPRLVPVEDEEVSKELERNFRKKGITVMTNSSVESVDTTGAGVKARVKTETGEVILEADILLSAVGIASNIENIGLEAAGVKTDRGKVLVDKYYRTNVAGVYAIGDITPGQALAHVASKGAVICVEAIAHAEGKYKHMPEPMDYGNIPGCTYCSPEIASVGMTEKQARDAGYELKIGKFPFSASGKASASGATEGFVKVIFDAKYGELLGTHMIGYNVTEMVAESVVARKLETTWQELLDSVHPHPTMSEGFKDAVEAALGEAIHL